MPESTLTPMPRRRRGPLGWFLAILSYGSSCIFAAMIVAVPWTHSTPKQIDFLPQFAKDALMRWGLADINVLSWLHPSYHWIALIYLVIQFRLIVRRDPLRIKLVSLDNILSLAPGIVGIVVLLLAWIVPTIFTKEGVNGAQFAILFYWTACAWFDYVYGMIIAQKIVVSTYNRNTE